VTGKFLHFAGSRSRLIACVAIALTCGIVVSGSFPISNRLHAESSPSPTQSMVRIGVLGLFHPRELVVDAIAGHALLLQADNYSELLEKSSSLDSVHVRIVADGVVLVLGTGSFHAKKIIVHGRNGEPVDFYLEIPGKIGRSYHGTLEIRPADGTLLAIVSLDRESAVASVVAAESSSDTPLEALKAQAIAARSYIVSGRGRHHEFDFCDTTHCQFLREPPASDSAAAIAVSATHGLVLVYNSQPFSAMYTRSCSGHTRTPSELGMPSAAYPYYSVECRYCRAHPDRWTSRLSALDTAALRSSNEASRMSTVRRLGWSAVPSNAFSAKQSGDHFLLQGTGYGHGIGLCQAGAKHMALEGSSYRQIIEHYYPNTNVVSLPN
jgi:stage II sporulation protein D